MKFDSRSRRSRLELNPLVVSVAFTVAISLIIVAAASSTPPHDLVANSLLSNVVAPMDMKISGMSTGGPGQDSLVVTLSATNDIGLNRNYANAIVTLQSLNLSVSYQYRSSTGSTESNKIAVTVNPPFTMLTGEQKALVITVAPLPVSAVGPVTVQVSGCYRWVLHTTNTDGSQTTGYGGGRLSQFGTVTAP